MRGDNYQYALIALGTVATLLMAYFFYQELFPEYKIYQKAFVHLEEIRSTFTGEPPAPFKYGVKQIVTEREDKGPAKVERCISCHVALEIPDFSPTSPNYIWNKVDPSLKTVQVGEFIYDMTRVLRMHPLIGKETRPFELHPLEEYGCISCHNGNGQGLVTDRAHGPVFDGAYAIEDEGFKPEFLEKDPAHDPPFSRIFNNKPGHRLLFQTNPIYVGALIQAKCVQCHLPSEPEIKPLTKEFQLGQELYVSQACYACHRIAGVAEGGVGPDLTREGNSYPWFVKESLVWPQADLKTSTMPNYKLDHEELEALLTYLLAQKGEKKWPKLPVAEHDGLTIFATEGCASCHRLHGYDYAKTDSSWFKKLFPETLLGSDIVTTIEKQGSEIDEKIVPEKTLLTAIDDNYPGLIAAYYAPFKYAQRANVDPKYQERLHKVLLTYVQEYGLGRIIGPKPNWSGLYRSEKWLMEHFKNPQGHIPRSIMPIMPFDDAKFATLTAMLKSVGNKNRIEDFHPEQAYSLLCAQCHGDSLQGDGPVAEWIYPIPKNLRKVDFLKNLTRERVADSIRHGVSGTPMPPWGEGRGEGVLSDPEIEQMTDWLFAQTPIQRAGEIPKWNYSAENFAAELKMKPDELFTIAKNPPGSPDAYSYRIKREFFTPEAIKAGEAFFELNCATCHGPEADGSGIRAAVLDDAKPRMLTNLDWIQSRDDLRLIRSIKFGVPGTAMTPWGDLTSAKQQLELTLFIRSLKEEKK